MDENRLPYGPPPTSPLYQGDCSDTPDPNPYFPKPGATWHPKPPFWYRREPSHAGPNWPVGNPDDYMYEKLSEALSGNNLLETFEIDQPERYLPGEIWRNEPVKRPIEDLSKTANCPKIWSPKDPGFYCEFQPTPEMMNPPRLLDGVLSRKAETFCSYITPRVAKPEESCEGVEDVETKEVKKLDYLEALKYSDTRPKGFQCAPDTSTSFEDACKIPDPTIKVPLAVGRKVWRPTTEAERVN